MDANNWDEGISCIGSVCYLEGSDDKIAKLDVSVFPLPAEMVDGLNKYLREKTAEYLYAAFGVPKEDTIIVEFDSRAPDDSNGKAH